ncbi:MAG: 23S rRNA (adenine(2503)-C(2))-methyltransferase RlmN, partial [Bacteroidetes bacterium]|nr:23S rRNA (adenine(2503)-C(2))-methyltransferase RlmN [Bacteroidota bacterium]
VDEWLWKKGARSFDEMTDLSMALRIRLSESFDLHPATIVDRQQSTDNTTKYVFKFFDGDRAEGVLIPSAHRSTACISVQAGCQLSCRFCATGRMKFRRNLSAGEIFDQVLLIRDQSEKLFKRTLSNIVIMGMGEPLLNYGPVSGAISRIISPEGMEMSPQRITLSTVGIPPMIRKLADENVRFNLAVSLHSANNHKRSALMPVNKKHDLSSLAASLKYFNEKTGMRISFEYLMLKNINDDIRDASELALFCRNFPCKINIIEYNPAGDKEFQASAPEKVRAFVEFLEAKNMIVNIRKSRGKDIDAACGQLAIHEKGINLSNH